MTEIKENLYVDEREVEVGIHFHMNKMNEEQLETLFKIESQIADNR